MQCAYNAMAASIAAAPTIPKASTLDPGFDAAGALVAEATAEEAAEAALEATLDALDFAALPDEVIEEATEDAVEGAVGEVGMDEAMDDDIDDACKFSQSVLPNQEVFMSLEES